MTLSSYKVFMSFAEGGDSSRVLGKDCYDKWVATRKGTLKQPEESFRRVLTAHICGLIGRKPFPPHIESDLLKLLRERKIWECFENTGVSIGVKGFRKRGFHEGRKGIFGKTEPNPVFSSLGKRAAPSDDFDTSLDTSLLQIPLAKKSHFNDFASSLNINTSLNDLSWLSAPAEPSSTQSYSKFEYSNPYNSYLAPLQKVPSTPRKFKAHNSPKSQPHSNLISWPSFAM